MVIFSTSGGVFSFCYFSCLCFLFLDVYPLFMVFSSIWWFVLLFLCGVFSAISLFPAVSVRTFHVLHLNNSKKSKNQIIEISVFGPYESPMLREK